MCLTDYHVLWWRPLLVHPFGSSVPLLYFVYQFFFQIREFFLYCFIESIFTPNFSFCAFQNSCNSYIQPLYSAPSFLDICLSLDSVPLSAFLFFPHCWRKCFPILRLFLLPYSFCYWSFPLTLICSFVPWCVPVCVLRKRLWGFRDNGEQHTH